MPQCAKINYHTHTCATHFGKPTGFSVPVTIPITSCDPIDPEGITNIIGCHWTRSKLSAMENALQITHYIDMQIMVFIKVEWDLKILNSQ
jgi:hypothetical protein